ncbi:aldehyde reductase [Kineosporia sp. NBRC 101731]|uniref:SDR family oxidoreductase n=1 Tax=Kineosporia sp. NBRC 101731 TaxID=3032199 RepID=UPI0024A4985C|nr:aldehyde reductase [Kineosporia sp. NBRC 101731]GLY29357.1 dihydroflavonol-4-reductase [Kineosporia sp. NBRC 101731]
MSAQRVLVTGGSGFIAGHCILQLLGRGYSVRTTVRSLEREAVVRSVLAAAGVSDGADLSFVAADLLSDAGWPEAVAGCDVVLHIASPVAPGGVKDENDVILPARDGTLRVLRAARDAGVRRLVLTSSFHSVAWGHPHDRGRTFTEADWGVVDGPGMDAYGKSKTLAERAAWDFVAAQAGALELTTILPTAVMGPVMGPQISGSNGLVQRILDGALPGYLNLFFPIVDVRDVAAAHVAALDAEGAAGERFLVSGDPAISMKQVGEILRERLGDAAPHLLTRSIPDFVVRFGALFSAEFRPVVPNLGHARQASNAKARRVLGFEPRPAEESIVDTARSLIAQRLVRS